MMNAGAATQGEANEEGWQIARPSAFTNLVGPVWYQIQPDGSHRYGIRIREHHDNTQRRAHGGLVMTLCDDAMGHTAIAARPGATMFTVSFECQFISGSEIGEFLEAHCEVVRATRSLMFMRSTCRVGDRVVAASSGIWKVMKAS